MPSISLCFLLLFISMNLQAKSLGVIGQVFPVAEMSLLEFIELRVKELSDNGTLNEVNHDFIERVSHHADRPRPYNLSRTESTKSHFFSPEVQLSQTLVDHNGQILYPAGTKVNALKRMPTYKPCWFFFDGDDKAQVLFVKKKMQTCRKPKLILTSGSISDAEKAIDADIYFDQNGRILKKIKLSHVPSQVVREENRLKITAFAILENGDEK